MRLQSELLEAVDREAARSHVTRTKLIGDALSARYGAKPPPQKPWRCPALGCNLRFTDGRAICPAHPDRKVVPVGE